MSFNSEHIIVFNKCEWFLESPVEFYVSIAHINTWHFLITWLKFTFSCRLFVLWDCLSFLVIFYKHFSWNLISRCDAWLFSAEVKLYVLLISDVRVDKNKMWFIGRFSSYSWIGSVEHTACTCECKNRRWSFPVSSNISGTPVIVTDCSNTYVDWAFLIGDSPVKINKALISCTVSCQIYSSFWIPSSPFTIIFIVTYLWFFLFIWLEWHYLCVIHIISVQEQVKNGLYLVYISTFIFCKSLVYDCNKWLWIRSQFFCPISNNFWNSSSWAEKMEVICE
jgi:hypothetical protein